MGAIYQLTFFAALAILAILITVFVFAVSLLGRAMEAAASSEKEKLAERKEKNAKEMAAIKKEIEEAEASGQIPRGLTRKLEKLEKRNRQFDRELAKIRKAPQLLTVRGGVVPPSASLLGALILTGAAWYLSNIQIPIAPVIIWVLGLAGIAYSIIRIYRSLKVIESVAITSETEAERRLARAVKVALVELEEERKPELELTFKDKEFPLHIKADSEVSISLELRVTKGDIAEDVSVYIGASQGFDFPGQHLYTLPPDHEYPNYMCLKWDVGKVIRGLVYYNMINIKSPPTVGSFNMMYYIVCSGFWATNPTELEIMVE